MYFLIRARASPPPSFGQCPKENIFFLGGVPLRFWQWQRLFGLSVVFFGFSFSRFSHPWWMSHFIELVTVERRMDNLSIKFKFHLDSVKRMEEMKEAKRTRLTTWGRLFRDKDRSCQQTWHLGQCERGPRSPFLYSSHLWTVFCCIL